MIASISRNAGRAWLQLFADGGAGAGAAGGGAGGGSGTASAQGATGVTAGAPGLQNGRSTGNPLADVKYGVQPEAQPSDAQNQTPVQISPEERRSRFEQMIKGEYKDLYDERVQNTVQKRLKNTQETVSKYNELTPTLQVLYDKYGVEPGDVAGLNKAIAEDDSYYEDEALEKGLTVQQLKEIKRIQRENEQLKAAARDREQQAQIDRDVAGWMTQAKEAAKVFPGLDLKTELANPQFVGLLKSGVDVQTAYFALHHTELVPAAMQYAAKQTEQQVANKIRAGASRPAENGTRSQSPHTTKTDVSQLSKADIDEVIRRVARGERITFS